MKKDSKIFVAGHNGLIGSAIVNTLKKRGYTNIIFRNHAELDLCDSKATEEFFQRTKPEYVFLAAAKVGGIQANSDYPVDFFEQNMLIEMNVIRSSHTSGVKKLLFLGSTCIYPRECPQPIKEEYFLTGALEATNDAYAIAKIAGIILCRSYNKQYGTDFISVMPTNSYGPNDSYDPRSSHVFPALIKKFSDAVKNRSDKVELWGSGTPTREFICSLDVASAVIFLMNNYSGNDIFNIGTGREISIKGLADLIARETGFKGKLIFDSSKPDGTPRKVCDVSKIKKMGWEPEITLEEGVKMAVAWYKQEQKI